jgi:hypothetical protein
VDEVLCITDTRLGKRWKLGEVEGAYFENRPVSAAVLYTPHNCPCRKATRDKLESSNIFIEDWQLLQLHGNNIGYQLESV